MLIDVQEAVRRLLEDRGGLSRLGVGVRFQAPTRERIDGTSQPTIFLFLFDLRENTELRQSAFRTNRAGGYGVRCPPARRIDLSYLVAAVTTDADDEQRLLWQVLVTLLRHQELPVDLLPGQLAEETERLGLTVRARVGQTEEGPRPLELWRGLGVDPRPALSYVLTVPLPADGDGEPVRLVLSRTLRSRRADGQGPSEEHTHLGGQPRGAPRPER